jgi:hypothetical protein
MAAFDPASIKIETITIDEAAHRLKICVGSVRRLVFVRGCFPQLS